jgi:25S rRNA (uracil2843-N3)-methyltransferase
MESQILNLLAETFQTTLQSSSYKQTISEIKFRFKERDYNSIFERKENLPYYVAEYTPTRALCYFHLGKCIERHLVEGGRIHCMGGGSCGELIGFSAFRHLIHIAECQKNSTDCQEECQQMEFVIHDYADYSDIITQTQSAIEKKFIKSNLKVSFIHSDVTEQSTAAQKSIQEADLITCMFLLNELFAASKAGFVQFITRLLQDMKKGSMLLVVDSAGSFSDVKTSSSKRIYSVWMLLDALRDLEIVEKDDSRWFRLPPSLQQHYPVKVENCRYFLRFYRKK